MNRGLRKRGVKRKYLIRRLAGLALALGIFVGVSAAIGAGVTWAGSQLSGWFNPSRVAFGYDVDTASSLTVVVNKARPLNPITFYPSDIGQFNLTKPAAAGLAKMQRAMATAGAGNLVVMSGFRDYASQQDTFLHYTAALGDVAGGNRAARPGFSEHQTGLAADVAASGQSCAVKACFAKTTAGKWLAKNSWRYGFILRYPKDATDVTGYQFEPWHFRFVGTKLAREMHTAKATVLESYLGLPAAPDYLDSIASSTGK